MDVEHNSTGELILTDSGATTDIEHRMLSFITIAEPTGSGATYTVTVL